MKQKSVLVLSAVTAGALLLAALALREPGNTAAPGDDGKLFPELAAHINDVTEIHLEKAGKSLTLRREGGQWKLVERGGYAAKLEQVKELAVRLAELEIEERKTALKANHATLGVQWPAATGENEAQAALVTLKDAAGKELAALVVGNDDYIGGKPKVFVRRASEDQVYLCAPRGALQISVETSGWIESEIVKLENDRVQSVSIEHADGEKIEIARSAADHTQFALLNAPIGSTVRYEGVANSVAQALGYGLTLEDVRPAGEVDFGKEPLGKSTFRCVDGLELAVESAKFEDKTWVKIVARYEAPPAAETPAPAAATPEGGAAETPDAAAGAPDSALAAGQEPAAGAEKTEKKDVGKEAEELNRKLAPWVYAVPSYKSEVLLRRMKDLLAEPDQPKAPPTPNDSLEGVMDQLGIPDETVEPAPVPDDEGKATPPAGGGKKPD